MLFRSAGPVIYDHPFDGLDDDINPIGGAVGKIEFSHRSPVSNFEKGGVVKIKFNRPIPDAKPVIGNDVRNDSRVQNALRSLSKLNE